MHRMRYLEKYARMIWVDLDACNEIHGTSYWEQGTKSDMHRQWCKEYTEWYITLDAQNDMYRKIHIKQYW